MVSTLKRLIVITGLCLVSLRCAAATAEIVVRPTSQATRQEVKLADIAALKCSDKKLSEKLQGVTICPSPLAGRTQIITRSQIQTALRRDGVYESVNLLAPPRISVTRASSVVTGQALFETARKFILDSGVFKGVAAEVEAVRLPADQITPVGQIEIRVGAGAQPVRRGRNTLPVEVVSDGKVFSSRQVPVQVRVTGHVLVATRAIAKNEPLTPDNTTQQEREVTNLSDDILTALPETGVVASMTIAGGSQIRKNMALEPPCIHLGDSVLVTVVGDCVRVTDKGTAVSDGRTGQSIRVRLGADAREVRAIIVEPGLVEIRVGTRS